MTKKKKRFAEANAVELLKPAADRVADRCVHEASPARRPLAGASLRAPARHKRDQVDEALRAIGGLDGFELEEIEPAGEQWRYRNKLEYSFGEREGALDARLPRRGRWYRIVDVEDCMLASRPTTRRATRCAIGPGARRSRPTTGASAGSAAQPGGPRGTAHRPGPDPPRHLAGPVREAPGRPPHRDRGPLGRHRRADRRARRGAPARGALRPAPGVSPRRLPPDQHRDGRAALRRRGRVRGPDRRRAGLRPLLRHRDDRAVDGAVAPARSGGWTSSPRRSPTPRRTPPQRDRQRPLRLRRRAARRPAADRGGGPARRHRRRPAARRASRRRSSAG